MSDVRRRAQPWLGTIVSIDVIVERAPRDIEQAFQRGFAAIARVHGSMSRQLATSDVARFNAARAGACIECDAWTVRVLRLAARLKDASAGSFDATLGSGAAVYRIVDATRIVKLGDAGRLDLGGIAKGFAVDRAVAALRAAGVRRGLVNAGGDLRAFGAGAWPILVRGGSCAFAIERGAIATSEYRGGYSPSRHDALVEPLRGSVSAIDRTITVAAPRCVFADALTKIVALSGDARHPLLGPLRGHAWLR